MLTAFSRLGGFIVLVAVACVGLVTVQLVRLQRKDLRPNHDGFEINELVQPASGPTGATPLRLTVLGDSTTVGIGVDRVEAALPPRLAHLIADAWSRPVQVATFGWTGARIEGVLSDQLPRAALPFDGSPDGAAGFLAGSDVVVLVAGANDATHRTRPGDFAQDLRTVLAGIRAAAPEAAIVVAGVPRFRGALREFFPLMLLADLIAVPLRRVQRREAARVGAGYADLSGDVPRLLRGRVAPADVLSDDEFHPGEEAYQAWAEVIAGAIPPVQAAA